MHALLIALSLFATRPDSSTETIRLQNRRPSEIMTAFNSGFLILRDKTAVYGSEIEGTLTLTGPDEGRNEFKQLIRMLDLPKRAVHLAIRVHSLTSKDGKVQDEVVFNPKVATYNNEDVDVLFRAADETYRLKVLARVNNDGTTTVSVQVSRLDNKGGIAETSKLLKRLHPGEQRGFGGILQEATADAATIVHDGGIPQSGLTRGIVVELAATPK